MFHIINKTPVDLQQYIDNSDGKKRIGLKSFTYTIGWYNIEDKQFIKKIQRSSQITPGYYSFQQISDIFQSYNITLTANVNNGIVTLSSVDEIKLSKGLKSMLGFNVKSFKPNETYTSDKPLDFAVVKSLYIHLKQLNTSYNVFNGAPSHVLAVVPIENKEFGDIIFTRFEHPEYKCLSDGSISVLELEIRDENNKKIDNHDMPFSAVLEIL